MPRPPDVRIRVVVDAREIAALVREHLEFAARNSPEGGAHALDLDGLRSRNVTIWGAWGGDELLGCAALKELDPTHGELKSMRTATAHLRKGVATALLDHVLEVARKRGYRRLSLETGSGIPFLPALSFYERRGFEYCGVFGDYTANSFSIYMTRKLD